MTTKKFSKGEAVRFGWAVMEGNLGFFIGLLIVAGLIYIVPNIVAEFLKRNLPLYILLNVISYVLATIVQIGLIRIALIFCEGNKGKIKDLFSSSHLFYRYLLATIVYMLIVIGGMLLLIIPGIIWSIKFWFYGYFIIDKGAGPIESLKRSSAITKGIKWDLFVFSLLLGGINILGALCLLVGLFATIPITMVATAFVYRKLLLQFEIIKEA